MDLHHEFLTDRLLLRALTQSDQPAFRQAVCQSAGSISPWLDWCHDGFDELEAEAWIQRSRQNWLTGSSFELVFIDRQDMSLSGAVYISSIDTTANQANLGYWVRTSKQGRGFAAEAAEIAIQIAFTHLLITRLELVMDPANEASINVASKLGATYECLARNRYVYDGEAKDGLVYSLIPDDFL